MRFRLQLVALPLVLTACGDKFPLPDEFDAAFTTGQVCAPSQVATGNGRETFPVQFDLCLYRCVTLDRDTAKLRTVYSCVAGQCQMTMLATAHAHKVQSEQGCDARDLVDPPEGECTTETFQFDVSLPEFDGEPATGDFRVTIPYLELEEGQTVIERIDSGEDPATVIREEIGTETFPERQFTLNFDAAHVPLQDHGELMADDCHTMTAP